MPWEVANRHLQHLIEQTDEIDARYLYAEFMRVLNVKPNDRLWYFAYGSQIWAPGFSMGPFQRASVKGYFRDYCILSHLYRGTEDNPGLVLGLRPEEHAITNGVVFHVAVRDFEAIFRQEMVSGVYKPFWLDAHTEKDEAVKALTFISRPEQKMCVSLSLKEQARLIIKGAGCRGRSLDYFNHTQKALHDFGIPDERLAKLEHEIAYQLQQEQQQQ